MRAGLVVGSVTTSELPVLYVFAVLPWISESLKALMNANQGNESTICQSPTISPYGHFRTSYYRLLLRDCPLFL
ncbi:hypothetical protein BDP55DRAFT_683875 [Colletotrichum godetiae]|uniref:Uncharacterized protein n=1 Tax=Colletotrichum godetiae TaxID=1209918 RepID=A0AAJ0ABN5_9PEZI|nr:uncharacterized protein BDP55DRAFT_683875 [Colletotrichum godetiae]KAK1658030.1 hypothetical protein BDP55DRAFT_683875 [Colletotrichum godetiae]